METDKINLIVFDEPENFNQAKNLLGYEGATIKRFFCIQTQSQFKDIIENQLKNDEYIVLVVHVFGTTDNLEGISKFKASGIIDEYPNLDYMFISEGNKQGDIKKLMIDNDFPVKDVYKYHKVLDELKSDKFKTITIKQLSLSNDKKTIVIDNKEEQKHQQFDYAIITALEENEMEKILPFIEKEGNIDNSKHLIEYGHIKGKENKKIIYASQQATGMIDAAILTTELLQFKPKYLIMAGVLGGKPKKTTIGDVVVATKTFTVDKGKTDKLGFHPEAEASSNENACITKLRREKNKITNYLKGEDKTRNSKIKIHFGPIGCVRQVIDLEGFFQNSINKVDRKAIALEMESYAVSRSCELVNEGRTKTLIIKSVMDNTVDKDDNGKPYAGWSSAMFVKYILENDLI